MHFKNKPLLDSNMNKTYKSPSTDEVDSLLLKRAEYAKKYPRPRKSSSPKSSPKLSSNKRDYWKLKSAMMNSSLRDTFDNLLQNDEDDNNHPNSSKLQERLNESTSIQKTKSKWYNALYPTYKSRVEEFKRTFENIPDNERLIVDYSCGLQKDVLVHGRLYISQNYFCFYSNSYMTETSITLPWIDIASITKDKSSLMPNGILISTETDKLFLTTFGARDKTYSIMFRIWKSALINQPITDEEMWQLIHSSYGDELGLTSDDEEEKNFPSKYLGDSFSEFEASFMAQSRAHSTFSVPHESLNVSLHMNSKIDFSKDLDNNNTTTESESENENYKTLPKDHPVCTSQHEGRELINTTLPINIDQLFILLFTGSKFFSDFHASRKTTDLIQSSWIKDPETGAKTRNITMTVSLTQPVGPKTSKVTENQVMLPCSLPGSKYCIDIETLNSGIPYADSFSVETHFCMTSLGDEETNIKINSNVNFKKHVWAMMKSLILKNCWNGLEEFYGSLVDAVAVECEGIKKKTDDIEENTKKNETYVFDDNMKKTKAKVLMNEKKTIGFLNNNNQGIFKGNDDSVTIISWVLLAAVMFLMIINGLLYYKLWGLEDAAAYTVMDLHVLRKTPKSEEEWINLLQQQESLHNVEMRKWQRVLHTAAQLLKQTEESLTELRKSMHPTESEKVFSVLKEHF